MARRSLRERLYGSLAPCPDDGCECLLSTMAQSKGGYARIWSNGRYVLVHRAVWELERGPIPDGLVIDHVKDRGCSHEHCANIAHLEPVTQRENNARSSSPSALNAAKTRCPAGHPYDEVNTFYYKGWRGCRICHRIMGRRTYRRATVAATRQPDPTTAPSAHTKTATAATLTAPAAPGRCP